MSTGQDKGKEKRLHMFLTDDLKLRRWNRSSTGYKDTFLRQGALFYGANRRGVSQLDMYKWRLPQTNIKWLYISRDNGHRNKILALNDLRGCFQYT